jgi:large subunit ribosomal protein L35
LGPFLPYSRAFRRPAKGLPWRRFSLSRTNAEHPRRSGRGRCSSAQPVEEMTQMPKMKTKSGAKKRFKITGGGKVMSAHAGKRHGMIKRTNKQIRHHRGTRVLFKTDGEVVKKNWLPNG